MTLSAASSTLVIYAALADAEHGTLHPKTAAAIAENPPVLGTWLLWTTPPTDRALTGWGGRAVRP